MVGKIKQKTRKYRKHKNKNIRARKTRTRTRNISSRKAQTKRVSKHNGGKKNAKKWSMKYKKSINCIRPKGFSQKQYCKYGRKQKEGV